jgi:hypothetical protein
MGGAVTSMSSVNNQLTEAEWQRYLLINQL